MKRCAALLVLLAILAGAAVVHAEHLQAHDVLTRALGDLDRAVDAAPAQRDVSIAAVVGAVEVEPSIGLSDSLLAPLKTDLPDVRGGHNRLAATLESMSDGVGSGDLAARRRALDEVLGGPPFQTRDIKSISPEWIIPLIVLLEWLATQIGNVIRWPFDRFEEALRAFIDGPAYLPAVTLIALAAIASLVLLYRRGLRAALVDETELDADRPALLPTSAQALDRAQRLASDGRYRDASHFILLSALLWVEEHGQTRFERSATNWEHLQRIERGSPAAIPLRGLIDRFDRLWYGQADTSGDEYRDLEELALRVRQAVV